MQEWRTSKFKESQLETIANCSKEVIKNCAVLEAEIAKREEYSQLSLTTLAKCAVDKTTIASTDGNANQTGGGGGGSRNNRAGTSY